MTIQFTGSLSIVGYIKTVGFDWPGFAVTDKTNNDGRRLCLFGNGSIASQHVFAKWQHIGDEPIVSALNDEWAVHAFETIARSKIGARLVKTAWED